MTDTPATPDLAPAAVTVPDGGPTPFQLEEAQRRRTLVEALSRYPSLKAAAAALCEPVANLCRYRKAWDGSLASLMPAGATGRPAVALALRDDEIGIAKRFLLKTESLPLALEYLADSPDCSHATRDLLNRYREKRDYPPSLVKAVRFTEEEWENFRGKKHAQGVSYTTRRGMFEILEDGTRREIVSGDIIEADDVSSDVPYYVVFPDGTFSVGRQLLVFRDLRSGKWLYACAVARDRDSYRAEDIVRAARWLVEAHGLPACFRFERAAWESEMILGHKQADGTRWGGLHQLIPVQTMFSSNGKANIEGGFRMLHKVMGVEGVRIGKTRGEYEQPTADMLAVNEGRKHPADCGFIPWEKLLAALERSFTKLNTRARYDRHTGEHVAPDDVWWRDMQARPGRRLPACPPDLFYHFLPVKRLVSVGAVMAGHVQVSVNGYRVPFYFRCAGEGIPYLERQHKVWCCFDPHEAAAGAVIFNADTSPRNRAGYRMFERLFTAPPGDDRPQIDHRPAGQRGEDADVVAKKIRNTQVRAAGTSIGVFGAGARRVQHTHDGRGNVARVESGAPARSQAPRADLAQPVQPVRMARAKAAPVVVEDLDLATSPASGVHRPASLSDTLDYSLSAFAAPRSGKTSPAAASAPAVVFEDLD
ncbi:hypothetical protein [Geminisphaera colitermitum]|uniref:hypothetical protein n=1 Tax=Geminisphaera colitermitum TaxID=1148786 RepID=UPI000158C71D|nr:hypothetical protein [Geminisphaera colitermitum]